MNEHTSKGSFLKGKASNMIAWLREAGVLGEELPTFTELQATYMAELLTEREAAVTAKAFDELLAAEELTQSEIGGIFHSILQGVRDRDDLHEKFWRYLALFIEVVKQ